jgi:hypothetical protein
VGGLKAYLLPTIKEEEDVATRNGKRMHVLFDIPVVKLRRTQKKATLID